MPILATVALATVLAGQTSDGIKVPFEKYTLPNGMNVACGNDQHLVLCRQ